MWEKVTVYLFLGYCVFFKDIHLLHHLENEKWSYHHCYSNTSFLNCQCILLFTLSYHYWDLSSSYCSLSFHFHLQDSSVSCMVKNPSVLFILDWINFLLLKDSFSRQDFWLTFFSFSISNIAVHYLLASKASDEMPAIILLRIPCMWRVVSPLLFSRFSLSLGFKSVSYGFLNSFYPEFIQLLGCLCTYLSSNFRNFWPLILQIFPLPFCSHFLGLLQGICGTLDGIPQAS